MHIPRHALGASRCFRWSALSFAAALAACGGGQEASPAANDDTAAAVLRTGGGTASTAAAASDAICFYQHVNYQGESICTGTDSAWVGTTWNDRISSVRVKPGHKVQLFQHANYQGSSLTLSADTPSLVPLNFNDAASSYRVTAPAPTAKVGAVQIAQSLLFNSDDHMLVLVSGKAALVKVNVTSTDPKARPAGTLRVENTSTGERRDLPLTMPTADLPASVPEVPRFEDSYHATVPAELVKPGLRLTVQVGNAAPTVLTPRVGSGVAMKFVPIAVRIGSLTAQLPGNQGPHLNALFPVSSVTVQSHPVYVSTRVTTVPTTDQGWSDAFGKILREIADLHTLEGAGRHDYYYGFIPKRTWGLAGLAYVPGRAAVGFDMPSAPTSVRDVVAHELGHNFSLPHAACGGAGSPDPNYPYPNAQLGMPGRYVWPYLSDTNTFYDPRPTNRHDMMSYCGGQVFSDYNYRKMQMHLYPTDGTKMASAAAQGEGAAPQELLLISGELRADGSAEINPVKSLVGRAQLPEPGPYTLRIVSTSGIVDHAFAPNQLDHDSSTLHFGFTIPHPGTVQSISVLRDGRVIGQAQARTAVTAGTARILSAAASGTQLQEAQGTLQLSWNASAHPFMTVVWVHGDRRITLAQDLRGGTASLSTAELPAGGGFELILSDGVNATRQLRAR